MYSLFNAYEAYSSGIDLKFDVGEISLDIDTAIPCGLILNELVSNCLKYAFPDSREGEVQVSLRSKKDGLLTLSVCDNGIGFPKDLDFRETESLGLQLVCTLTDQILGDITLDTSDGTAFQITFPPTPPEEIT